MSINDATGSITHNTKNIADDLNSASSGVEGIVGSAGGGLGGWVQGLFGGSGVDFAGMKEGGIADFNSAIDKYREGAQDIIQQFNPDADMEQALKGEVATAVHEFLEAMKHLLQQYVQAIDIEKKAIQEAYDSWVAAAGSIAGNVTSDSGDIRGKADGISID